MKNPVLSEKAFVKLEYDGTDPMTLMGTVDKCCLLTAILLVGALFGWFLGFSLPGVLALMFCLIGVPIIGFITIFKKTWSPVTAPIYSVMEGFVLGLISMSLEKGAPGIVFHAVGLTVGILSFMLGLYKSGIIQVTERFKAGVISATLAIAVLYLIDMVLRLFGMPIPMLHEAGLYGVLFSLFVIVIAALNLTLDFQFIREQVEKGAPHHMEWYAAFGLIVTLIWLYLEILKLLSKLSKK